MLPVLCMHSSKLHMYELAGSPGTVCMAEFLVVFEQPARYLFLLFAVVLCKSAHSRHLRSPNRPPGMMGVVSTGYMALRLTCDSAVHGQEEGSHLPITHSPCHEGAWRDEGCRFDNSVTANAPLSMNPLSGGTRSLSVGRQASPDT